jgi:predicted anti-sigma-YlaC factor YlaD
MKTHLEEHEITTAVAGLDLEVATEEHLGSCVSCRRQVSEMQDVFEARRESLAAEAPDWERQRQEIMLRLPSTPMARSRRRRVWTGPLLAVAAVLVAAIGLRALWTPAPVTDPGFTAEMPVEQILAEVDAMLADDSIPGFEVIDQGMDDAIFENGAS